MAILGISCFYHDSAAALVSEEGKILAASQEERFSRKKNDSGFPYRSIDFCITKAIESGEEITAYVYYEKPIRVFMRLLETYFDTAPRGFSSFLPAMQTWISKKLFTKDNISKELKLLDPNFTEEKLFFSDHHFSHASSAFYPSPFKKAVVLCMDAVGEWSTSTAWIAEDNKINPLWEINFPDSVGMLYSAFTYYCGFKVNSGEYKLMGLAPYGIPKYKDIILNYLIDVSEDGSFKMNMKYFKYHRGLRMISRRFINLFGHEVRNNNDLISQFYMDIAASIQSVTEDILLKITNNLRQITQEDNLCLAGGVALNCVANGKILENIDFKNIWIQPAAGDSGGALGAALAYLYTEKKQFRDIKPTDSMSSSYLGPEFSTNQISQFLDDYKIIYQQLDEKTLCSETSDLLIEGNVIGWFQGRMEYGPRALGNRSILGDPRIKDMQKKMNLKIKNRESFRPFAPVILDGFQKEYFDIDIFSPYMLLTKKLQDKFLLDTSYDSDNFKGVDKVNQIRSLLPAITHIDNSCRLQIVEKSRNKIFYELIEQFYYKTQCPVLINTSFNVRGEPIVCTPEDALKCFIYTDIDVLVLGSFLINKRNLPDNIKSSFPSPFTIED